MIKKTILYDAHVKLGAKMAEFGGWLMPIQYSGIVREHFATRRQATIFDTCHMGEFSIAGPAAAADMEKLLSCSVASIRIGQCRYGLLCNEQGGVRDDQIIYRMAENEFLMVVNAATEPADFEWVRLHCSKTTRVENISAVTAKLDLQGPASVKIMQKLMALPVDGMKYYTWMKNRYRGREVLVSRTGYTGEIGFEVYCPNDLGTLLWNDSLDCGALPAGLGCRDTLRLEMGYPLYGHELDEKTNAAESGFTRAIAADKRFVGSEAVFDTGNRKKLLVGIAVEGRRTARNNDAIADASGRTLGRVTSGSFSPSLGHAVALGYVALESTAAGTKLVIKTERQELSGVVVELPFYRQATGREDLKKYL